MTSFTGPAFARTVFEPPFQRRESTAYFHVFITLNKCHPTSTVLRDYRTVNTRTSYSYVTVLLFYYYRVVILYSTVVVILYSTVVVLPPLLHFVMNTRTPSCFQDKSSGPNWLGSWGGSVGGLARDGKDGASKWEQSKQKGDLGYYFAHHITMKELAPEDYRMNGPRLLSKARAAPQVREIVRLHVFPSLGLRPGGAMFVRLHNGLRPE